MEFYWRECSMNNRGLGTSVHTNQTITMAQTESMDSPSCGKLKNLYIGHGDGFGMGMKRSMTAPIDEMDDLFANPFLTRQTIELHSCYQGLFTCAQLPCVHSAAVNPSSGKRDFIRATV